MEIPDKSITKHLIDTYFSKYKTQIRPPQNESVSSEHPPVVLMLSVGEEIWTSLRLMWPGNVLDFTQQPQWWILC